MANSNNNQEFFEALQQLEKEKGLDGGYLMEKIRAAILLAVKHDYGTDENVSVIMGEDIGTFQVSLRKTVVEEITDPALEILPDAAVKYSKKAKVGDVVEIKLDTKQFGRIAAQTAKHVIRQGIREAERGQQAQELQRRSQELVSALVNQVDPETGSAILEIGKSQAILPKSEQVGDETFTPGQHIKVYIKEVRESEKGPRVLISRTHPGLVKRLFENEVPEIFGGVVEIKAVAREAGSRTKIAVQAHDENVDAVGACIGPKGARVAAIVDELGGEKIDIITYSDDPASFISSALSPAKVVSVEILSDDGKNKSCRVTVPDAQLSLAIGNKGQNARLAAHLTGWKIDIRPESGFYGEGEDAAAEAAATAEALADNTAEAAQ